MSNFKIKKYQKGKKPKGKCWICGSKDHYANNCPKNTNSNKNATGKSKNFEAANLVDEKQNDEQFIATISDVTTNVKLTFKDFLLDSGATSHFTPYLGDLTDVEPHTRNIQLADSSIVTSSLMGKLNMTFLND